jgi:hypothetical protein
MATCVYLSDGCERAQSAAEPEIRATVAAEFAIEFDRASGWRRFAVWWAMEKEISRRLERVAPSGACY